MNTWSYPDIEDAANILDDQGCGSLGDQVRALLGQHDEDEAERISFDKHDCCEAGRLLRGVHHDQGCVGPKAPIVAIDGPHGPDVETDCYAQSTHYGVPVWSCMCCLRSAVAPTAPDECLACGDKGGMTKQLSGPLDLDLLDRYGLLPDGEETP